ncbi:hypothetical protein V8C42DRAFT_356632 [Trichoderma barbatum]
MDKYLSFLLIYTTFIAVVKADGLSDISNNLASDLGPLLALFGEQITRQYFSESTGFIDYFIFAMAPIGIIGTITAAIRICGSSSLRAFIGRAQEGEGATESELCTSTSADVCELFNTGGITRVLGRPDIVELIYTPYGSKSRFHLFTKYLEEHPDNPYWKNVKFSGSGHALFGKLFPSSDTHADFAPKPNLSLNLGVIRQPDWTFYVVAIIGLILQAGILVFSGTAVLLLGWNFQESDGEVITQTYAPGIFIAGTIILCTGVWGCATLIGQTTTETYYQRKLEPSSDVLYWVQPGPQVIGDQTFSSFAYSDANKVGQRNKIWMSSTQNSNRKKPEVLTFIAVSLVLVGYIGQFIGLRGLNAWISIAQLVITLIMSILRSILRIKRLNKSDNGLDERHDLVAGHELDWLAFNIAGRELQKKANNLAKYQLPKEDESQKYQKKLRWYVTGQHWKAPEVKNVQQRALHTTNNSGNNSEFALGDQLLQDRIRLSNLTGHSDDLNEMKGNTNWKDERVRVRAKARRLGTALCEAAACLLRDQTTNTDIQLTIKAGLSYDYNNCEKEVVTIKMKSPTGPDQINWSIDSSQLEAILGLWLWSMISKEYEAYEAYEANKRPRDSSNTTRRRAKRPIAKIFRVVSASFKGWDDSVDADMSTWLGSGDLKYTKQTLEFNAELSKSKLNAYSLADAWTEMTDETSAGDYDTPEARTNVGKNRKVWRYCSKPETSVSQLQRICGWGLIYDALEQTSYGQESLGTSEKWRVNVKGYFVKDKEHLLLEICAQELFIALLRSMDGLKFRKFGGLSVSQSRGNIRLENPCISSVTKCFTENALGNNSDAIFCLIPILKSQIVSYHETLLSALTKAATEYRQDKKWKSAEIILLWSCLYYRSLPDNEYNTTYFMVTLQQLCELYRWSLAHIGDNDRLKFGIDGIKSVKTDFLSEAGVKNQSELVALVELYQQVSWEFLKKELRSSKDKIELSDAIAFGHKAVALAYLCYMKIGDTISPDSSSWLPLAARNGWEEIVSALLEIKSHPDHQDLHGRTAASHCAELGYDKLLQRFVDLGANLNLADNLDMTPLNYAVKSGCENPVKLLSKAFGLDIDRQMYNGRSALWFAADRNHVNIIKLLLYNGANINIQDMDNDRPLDIAVKRGHKDVVKLLLERGAGVSPAQPTVHPLIWASWSGDKEMVKILLENSDISNTAKEDDVAEARKLLALSATTFRRRDYSAGICSTLDIRPPSFPSPDNDKQHIAFEPSYSAPPHLMIGMTALNIRSDSGLLIGWKSTTVSETGFDLTREMPIVWLGFGAEEKGFQVGESFVSGGDDFKHITFQNEFNQEPKIVLWFSGLFLSHNGEGKRCCYANSTDITTSGFKLAIRPEDRRNRVSVTWLAYSPENTHVQSGNSTIGTADLHHLNGENRVKFDRKFESTPRISLAFSGFNMKFSREVDIEVKITESDACGFSWTGTSPLGVFIDQICVDWVAFG